MLTLCRSLTLRALENLFFRRLPGSQVQTPYRMPLDVLCFCCNAVITFSIWHAEVAFSQSPAIAGCRPQTRLTPPPQHRELTPRTTQPSEGPIAADTKYWLSEVGPTSLAENAVCIAGKADFVSDFVVLPLTLSSVLSEFVLLYKTFCSFWSDYHIFSKITYTVHTSHQTLKSSKNIKAQRRRHALEVEMVDRHSCLFAADVPIPVTKCKAQ